MCSASWRARAGGIGTYRPVLRLDFGVPDPHLSTAPLYRLHHVNLGVRHQHVPHAPLARQLRPPAARSTR
jgi:hypothetical protein